MGVVENETDRKGWFEAVPGRPSGQWKLVLLHTIQGSRQAEQGAGEGWPEDHGHGETSRLSVTLLCKGYCFQDLLGKRRTGNTVHATEAREMEAERGQATSPESYVYKAWIWATNPRLGSKVCCAGLQTRDSNTH